MRVGGVAREALPIVCFVRGGAEACLRNALVATTKVCNTEARRPAARTQDTLLARDAPMPCLSNVRLVHTRKRLACDFQKKLRSNRCRSQWRPARRARPPSTAASFLGRDGRLVRRLETCTGRSGVLAHAAVQVPPLLAARPRQTPRRDRSGPLHSRRLGRADRALMQVSNFCSPKQSRSAPVCNSQDCSPLFDEGTRPNSRFLCDHGRLSCTTVGLPPPSQHTYMQHDRAVQVARAETSRAKE